LKTFKEYLKSNKVRKAEPDKQRSFSLKKEYEQKITNLNEKLEKLGIKDENSNDYIEYIYDIIMLNIRSKLFEKGYYVSGQGAHEVEVSYLRELGLSEKDVQFCDQLRYHRNGILYYGKKFKKEYAKKTIEFLKKLIKKLNQNNF